MTFLSKFCDTIFFYHANPLTVILSSKCCMMFLVMVFSGDIITLFSTFTNPQRKSFLATTEPSGEHLKVLCCSASYPVPSVQVASKDFFCWHSMISPHVFCSLTHFSSLLLSQCSHQHIACLFKKWYLNLSVTFSYIIFYL